MPRRSAYPKVNDTVTYFEDAPGRRGRRVPAQVTGVRSDKRYVDLKLADGRTLTAVPRNTGRQDFDTWGTTRAPAASTLLGSLAGSAAGIWRAKDAVPYLGRVMPDYTGGRNHAYAGSTKVAFIRNGVAEFPGVAGNYVVTPDQAALDITGDIDLQGVIAPDSWTGSIQLIVGKEASSTTRSYRMYLDTTGKLNIAWSVDGSTAVSLAANLAVPGVTNGVALGVRVTLDVDNGAVGKTATFYTSTDGGNTWTQFDQVISGGTTSIFASTSVVEIGSRNAGTTDLFKGRIYRVIVKNGIGGTTVADFDPSRMVDGSFGYSPVANLLDKDTSDFEGGAGVWVGNTNCSVARSIAQAKSGSASLAITSAAAGTMEMITPTSSSAKYQITPGVRYAVAGEFRAATVGRGCRVKIWWYDANQQFITATNSSLVSDTTTDWTRVSTNVVAPANAYYAIVTAEVQSTGGASEVHYVDEFGLWAVTAASAPTWSAGGAPWRVAFPAVTTNDPTLLQYEGSKYAYFPNVVGNYIATPDAAAHDIADDLEIVAYIEPTSWTPAAFQSVYSKYTGTTATNSYRLGLNTAANGLQLHYASTTPTDRFSHSGALPAALTQAKGAWVKASRRKSDNRIQFHYSLQPLSVGYAGVTWIQIGTDLFPAGAGESIQNTTTQVEIGSRNSGTGELFLGKIYYVHATGTLGGAPAAKFDANAATEPFATLVATTGETWTFNRPSSGKKLAVVDHTMFLFGTDDYFEIPDADNLDFALTEPVTLVACWRTYGTPTSAGTLLAKSPATSVTAGWYLRHGIGTPAQVLFSIADGTNQAQTASATNVSSGVAAVAVGQRSVSADKVFAAVAPNTLGSGLQDTTIATAVNAEAVRLGRLSGAGTNYLDHEGIAWAVFRAALTNAQITALNTELLAL